MMRVKVHENGIVEFTLLTPVPADSEMRVEPAVLVEVMAEVTRTLVELEIKTNAPPALSFRPNFSSGEYELYRVTAAIPGTVQMRQGKKGWPPRRKK